MDPGPPPTTTVWIAPETSEGRAALDRWASAHDVSLRRPSDASPPRVAVDLAIADAVEQELVRAREAMGALDAEAVERALEAAESALRAHPELPQAAWLRAEVERAWSARFARVEPRDPDRAARAWARAAALDGGRAAGVGEPATADHRDPPPPAALTIARLPDGARAYVDGEPVDASLVARRPPGEHAVVVTEDGAVAWAAWVTLHDGGDAAPLPDLAPPACSRSDVSRAALRGGAIDAARVSCPAWIAVREVRAGVIAIARCEGARCGTWVEWRSSAETRPGGRRRPDPGWPSWATWTIVGAGAALAAGAIAVAAGAFDRAPRETRFVNGGLKPASAGPGAGVAF